MSVLSGPAVGAKYTSKSIPMITLTTRVSKAAVECSYKLFIYFLITFFSFFIAILTCPTRKTHKNKFNAVAPDSFDLLMVIGNQA